MTNPNLDQELALLQQTAVPVKRAAYSDRTAWMMALLSQLAYTPFDEESDDFIAKLAGELIGLTTGDTPEESIKKRLDDLVSTLAGLKAGGDADGNLRLKAVLKAGGFKLAGDAPIHDPGSDTQAFVAIRKQSDGTGMAVIVFRGTKQVKDWMTNLKTSPSVVKKPTGEIVGNFHEGFHDAYLSVHDEINDRLKGHEKLPLYITGHSLGGALAVVCTWYHSKGTLGACYTFGAPRVGDEAIMDKYRTPVYRIVNAADPVPFVPPAGRIISFFKHIVRLLGTIFPFAKVFDGITDRLVNIQKFRHIGYMRYLSFAKPDKNGEYPTLRVEFAVSSLHRIIRYICMWNAGKQDRIDKYHDIDRYRDKLRYWAIKRSK